MSTANTITVSCLLDDGTGTYPYDISSKVSLSAGIDVSGYGRGDESTSASAAQLTFTVKNDDGYFTTLVTVPLVKGRLVKFALTVGGTPRNYFTGRIDSIAQAFAGAPGKRSDITITALDALTDYARRPLRSMVEQEILKLSPSAYYTLGEAEGSTSAGDTSGRGAPALAIAGTGTAPTFGTGIGPPDGLPACQFFGGKYLSGSAGALLMTGSWSTAMFFSTTQTGAPGTALLNIPLVDSTSSRIGITLQSSGLLGITGPGGGGAFSGAAVITDGQVHCAVATFDGTNLRLYVDGALQLTTAGNLAPNAPLRVEVAASPTNAGTIPFIGVISHLGIWDGTVLTAGQALSMSGALTSFVETTDARLTRLASYAGTTGITTSASGQLMGGQSTSGLSLLDAVGAVADAEGGFLYVDGSGQLRLQGRYYRALKTTASLSLSGKAVDPSAFSVVDDTQQTINSMTVTRTDGATQTWPLTSPTTNLYPGSLDLAVDTDENALLHAQFVVSKHSSPGPRLPSAATTNMRTSASATSLHARELGDRIALTALPATTNPALGDVTIEGWSMHLDRDTWTFTYNLLPWSLAQAFTLDSATYGVLNSTTPIGY